MSKPGMFLAVCCTALAAFAGTPDRTAAVEEALVAAGENRAEIERVLAHYRELGDGQKLAAAEFLVANMPGHGYSVTVLYDEEKNEIPFDALSFEKLADAQAALEALEKEHGELHFGKKEFVSDLETISADYLIQNIELAFQAWRGRPWARDVTFEVFCDYILPYRGSNEPLDSFRGVCVEAAPDEIGALTDAREAAKRIRKSVRRWVRFSDLYYLHPTDQGFSEMKKSGFGRCEDISNMMGYAMRANAVPAATDYTPYWADRDNNHAWEVVLDAEGRGKGRLSNRAAKIYRKTFSAQPEALGTVLTKEEKAPRWLSGKNYKDVTSDYFDAADVTVAITVDPPAGARFAYLSVFNGGEWKAIHWGRIATGSVTFTKMGRNIAYLPSHYVDEEIVPAAAPLILTENGDVRLLDGDPDGETVRIELGVTTPETPDADTGVVKPRIKVKPGVTYELFAWDGGWESLGKKAAGDAPVAFDLVPAGRLYWLVAEGSRKLERIFTFEDGKIVWF